MTVNRYHKCLFMTNIIRSFILTSLPLSIFSQTEKIQVHDPVMIKQADSYYLFVSFDFCCRGIESNYKVMVGRSENITGPYVDKNGVKMIFGGGTPVLTGNKEWPGVGHNAVCSFDGEDYIIYHGYDAKDQGKSKLLIEKLTLDGDGWPLVPK